MRLEVEVNSRIYGISIQAGSEDGDTLAISVDGQSSTASVRSTELGFVLVFDDGRVVDAAVEANGGGRWVVDLRGVALIATTDRRRRFLAGRESRTSGEQRVLAPMPGRVVRLLVMPGDEVTAGQGLVVVEAMKMENELTSPKAGRVKAIDVGEGASIESGRLLVVIE
jgi:biotin carboxyl carrier protein